MKKLYYLDSAKGIGMLLIILGHILMVKDSFLLNFIYTFHVPLFFIISGILIEYTKEYKKPFFPLLLKKIKRLIIPYFVYDTLYNIIYSCINGFENFRWCQIDTLILYGRTATWFLPVLFLGELFIILLHKVLKKTSIITLISLFIFIFSMFITPPNGIIYVLLRITTAIGFLTIGMFTLQIINRLDTCKLALPLLFLLMLLITVINGKVSCHTLKYNNILLFIAGALIGSLFCLLLCKKTKLMNIFEYFGRNSVIIMCTHQSILLLLNYFVPFSYRIPSILLYFLVVVLLEIIIIPFVNKYLPFTIGNFVFKN